MFIITVFDRVLKRSSPAVLSQGISHGMRLLAWEILLLLTNVRSARLRESGVRPISPKTPAPQYQPIDRKKRKGKKSRRL